MFPSSNMNVSCFGAQRATSASTPKFGHDENEAIKKELREFANRLKSRSNSSDTVKPEEKSKDKTDVVIIGNPPGEGKTALAVSISNSLEDKKDFLLGFDDNIFKNIVPKATAKSIRKYLETCLSDTERDHLSEKTSHYLRSEKCDIPD